MQIDIKKIRYFMFKNDLNQTTLAEKSGISRTWLNVVLKKEEATNEVIYKIAKALEVEPEEILLMEV